MDIGCYDCENSSYGNTGCTPPYLNAEERYSLGWLSFTTLDSTGSTTVVPNISKNKAYIVPSSHDSEFFLLENRQETGWDAGLPGHGLLVWQINYDSTAWNSTGVNNSKLRLDVIEADGKGDSYGDAGDPFPGTSSVTTESFTTWGGTKLSPSLYHITEKSGVVCFTNSSGVAVSGCDSATTEAEASGAKAPSLSVHGATLVVSGIATGAMEVRFYGLDALSGSESSLSLASLRGRGMTVAQLVADGRILDQRTIAIP
jgi:immune inhibitor A